MANVVFTIKGYNRVRNNLRRLASDMDKELDPVVEKWAKVTRADLKGTAYPPKRAGQKYIRTGQLANRWKVVKLKNSQYTIENNARGPRGQLYAHHVIGDRVGGDQAWMHEGRWWTAYSEIQKRTPKLRRDMAKKIEQIWNSGSDND